MNLTVALTGALPAVVIISAVLTALVSILLLRLYRRAVMHAMNVQAGVPAAPLKTTMTSTAVKSKTLPVLNNIDLSI